MWMDPIKDDVTSLADAVQRVRAARARLFPVARPKRTAPPPIEIAEVLPTPEPEPIKIVPAFQRAPLVARYGRIKSKAVLWAVCNHFAVTAKDVCGDCRMDFLVYPRHVAMYLCRVQAEMSFPEIGRVFGGRDHTTVLYAYRKIHDKVLTDDTTRVLIDHLRDVILSAVVCGKLSEAAENAEKISDAASPAGESD